MASFLNDTSVKTARIEILSMEIERWMKPTVVEYAHALASGTRVHIFTLLGENGMCVTDIASATGLATSTVCFHVAELERVGLVERKRKGRTSIYRWSDIRLSFQVERVTSAPTASPAP